MLVEGLRAADHVVQRLPAGVLVGAAHRELLHLLELVHPAPSSSEVLCAQLASTC